MNPPDHVLMLTMNNEDSDRSAAEPGPHQPSNCPEAHHDAQLQSQFHCDSSRPEQNQSCGFGGPDFWWRPKVSPESPASPVAAPLRRAAL